jgi:hypothetical protein
MEKTDLINRAMAKYPKAKRIAVENFTSGGYGKWDMAASMNLAADATIYKWNGHTVAAIRFVMMENNK